MNGQRKHIGIFLFPDVEELDAIGPWEVLAFWTHSYPEDGYDVLTFADGGGEVRCAHGLRVHVDHASDEIPPLEVLVYPGGQGTRPKLKDDAHLGWLRGLTDEVPLVTSVCTGSLVYAAAGLLRGRPATTHWRSLDLLADLDPTIQVRPDDRFVEDGNVITAAGISAGIDMALRLVARLSSVDRAKQVRRGIQYDPQPPV